MKEDSIREALAPGSHFVAVMANSLSVSKVILIFQETGFLIVLKFSGLHPASA